MTNAEKYLKDGVDINEIATGIDTIFMNEVDVANVEIATKEFFSRETKPTLTDDERVILRNIKDAELIGRTPNLGQLYVMTTKGETYEVYFNKMFGHLFQFIKERRRILN